MPSLGHVTHFRGEVREVLLHTKRAPGMVPKLSLLFCLYQYITDFWFVTVLKVSNQLSVAPNIAIVKCCKALGCSFDDFYTEEAGE